jgi:hypothetical protein
VEISKIHHGDTEKTFTADERGSTRIEKQNTQHKSTK